MSAAAFRRAVVLAGLVVVATLACCRSEPARGKKYALLVGVTEYRSTHFPTLKYAENDVEELAKVLVRPGSGFAQVRLLTTSRGKKNPADAPTAANIRKALNELLADRNKHDTILIALSGHGIQLDVKDPDGDKEPRTYGYFCPSDASLSAVRYSNGHSKHLIHLNDMFEAIGRCDAEAKLVLMDACRNELTVKASSRNVDLRRVNIPEGVGALFSARPGQKAFETDRLGPRGHGVFFHFVLQGLRGKAKNEDGEVTWDSLVDYVRRQVPREVPRVVGGGARQNPHLMTNLTASPVLGRPDADLAVGGLRLARYVPDRTGAMTLVNVRQILASPLVKEHFLAALKQQLQDRESKALFEKLGIDPLEDVDRLLLASLPLEKGEKSNRMLLLFEGRFDPDRVNDFFKEGAEARTVKGGDGRARTYYQKKDGTCAAVLNRGVIAYASAAGLIEEAIEKEANGTAARLSPAVLARLRSMKHDRSIWEFSESGMWEAARALLASLGDGDGKGLKELKSFADAVVSMRTEVHLSSDLSLEVVLEVKDATKGAELAKQARAMLEAVRTTLSDPRNAGSAKFLVPLGKLLGDVKVLHVGKQIIFRCKLPGKTLVKLLQDALAPA